MNIIIQSQNDRMTMNDSNILFMLLTFGFLFFVLNLKENYKHGITRRSDFSRARIMYVVFTVAQAVCTQRTLSTDSLVAAFAYNSQ